MDAIFVGVEFNVQISCIGDGLKKCVKFTCLYSV